MALTKFKAFMEQAPAKDYVPKKDGDEEAKGLEPRSKGERDFKAKHTIKKIDNPNATAKQFKAEEVEDEEDQLDEVSQDTLRRYHGAAALDLRKKREKLNTGTMTTKDHKQGQKRVAGLNRAANKMEDTEVDGNHIEESEGAGRADFKVGSSGRKIRKIVRFKTSDDAAEKERKEKGEE